MQSNELIRFGAGQLARLIRGRQVHPVEVVDAHITQTERTNPAINALVTATFDTARAAARRAGERLTGRTDELPPLLGVPISVKDSIPVAGVRFTAGSTFYRDNRATTDAESVRRLKAAGAIVLGKTNCPDMSGSSETRNLVFGLTRNPWNLARSAGGSSGGEGALIAAGGSPLGLGADLGGSIRIPAAFCGVVGLKPSAGRIPTTGHVPDTPEPVRHWNTIGPLARRVEDLALALSILSDTPVTDFRSVTLKGRRLIVPDFLWSERVSREIAVAVQTAARVLGKAGMVRRHVKLPLFQIALESAAIMYREWFADHRVNLGGGVAARFWSELIANYRGKGRVSAHCLAFMVQLSLSGWILDKLGYGCFDHLRELRHQVLEAIGAGGVMLWPVFPTTAPRHGFVWGPNGPSVYTAIFNSLGCPAVAVPLGLSEQGLPLSVQLVGRPNEDETILAAAARLESEFGGWRLAPAS